MLEGISDRLLISADGTRMTRMQAAQIEAD